MPVTGQKVPPDAEIVFRKFLTSKTGITDLVSTRIATRLPRDADLPFLVFIRAGGILVRPTSQAHIQSAIFPMIAYAGQWGGDNTKANPDYGGAMELANAVIQECFNMENEYVITDTSSTKAKIYGIDILQMPTRIEEVATGLGRYDFSVGMTYRAV
tara:strand:- start:499 stop:969 length:471 start_codon:yes stop_codon:yes gene_type:complete